MSGSRQALVRNAVEVEVVRAARDVVSVSDADAVAVRSVVVADLDVSTGFREELGGQVA